MSLWRATYTDGTTLLQKEDGHSVSSEAIDRSKIKSMDLLLNNGDVVATLEINAGQKFFYRRRVQMSNEHTQVCHILGSTTNGVVNVPVVFHLDEGWVAYSEFNIDHQWFYPINFRPCEL
jgi:hypothetical protein